MADTSMGHSQINSFAAKHAGEALRPYAYSLGALEPSEVEIAITHCGVCHSDLHLIDNDWGVSSYPLVPGREIVGVIIGVGSEGTGMRVGRRVGVDCWRARASAVTNVSVAMKICALKRAPALSAAQAATPAVFESMPGSRPRFLILCLLKAQLRCFAPALPFLRLFVAVG
jgi:NADPH:quinone reductase-like Zn-dependent oxidoreductase